MKCLESVSRAAEKIGVVLSFLILLIVFSIVTLSVFLRIAGATFSWSEELSRWCLVSLTFIGGSVALKRKLHVGMNLIVKSLPLKISKLFLIIAHLVVFIFLLFSIYYSFAAANSAKNMLGDIIQVPMLYVKLSLPLGMIMMLIHLLNNFFKIFQAKDTESILIGS